VLLQNPGDDTGEDDADVPPPPPPPPPPPASVSVLATDPNAWEGGPNTGTFTLTRTGGVLTSTLTVAFTLSGATNGTDYTLLPPTATFAANSTTATVTVTPIGDSLAEGTESVVLTLTGAPDYVLGSPATATVVIADGAVPQINVIVVDGTATEAGGPGSFRVTRTGDTTVGLTVTVSFIGTATNGTDYTTSLPNQTEVVFNVNVSSVTVTVVPQRDTVTDPSETVILMVIDGAAYDLGATPSGQVNISGS
jgi:hypothetical protein